MNPLASYEAEFRQAVIVAKGKRFDHADYLLFGLQWFRNLYGPWFETDNISLWDVLAFLQNLIDRLGQKVFTRREIARVVLESGIDQSTWQTEASAYFREEQERRDHQAALEQARKERQAAREARWPELQRNSERLASLAAKRAKRQQIVGHSPAVTWPLRRSGFEGRGFDAPQEEHYSDSQIVDILLNCLDNREADILIRCLVYDETAKQVGAIYEIGPVRVGQILAKCVRALRQPGFVLAAAA